MRFKSPKNEMDTLLKVQARVTKISLSLRNLKYETRIAKWEIDRLEIEGFY